MNHEELRFQLIDTLDAIDDPQKRIMAIEELKETLHSKHPLREVMPVEMVKLVPIERVQANDYNPNSVASNEMQLLYTSIDNDGYTQPVVTIYDEEIDKYVVVDGFHRQLIMKSNRDIHDRNMGYLPVVVLEKSINNRMASTVRHNRARGKHAVTGMTQMVFEMLENGWGDDEICNQIGLSADELLRLKHVTGFSKLYEDIEYRRAWVTRKQIKIRKQYETIGEERGWAGAREQDRERRVRAEAARAERAMMKKMNIKGPAASEQQITEAIEEAEANVKEGSLASD